jgi:hypothetical protein
MNNLQLVAVELAGLGSLDQVLLSQGRNLGPEVKISICEQVVFLGRTEQCCSDRQSKMQASLYRHCLQLHQFAACSPPGASL